MPDEPGGRIVLMLDAARGVQRPALRFVQHVARSAPALVLVVAAGPALQRSLLEPDFAGLRARLETQPPIECEEDEAAEEVAPVAMPVQPTPVPVPVPLPPITLEPERAPPRARLATLSVPVRGSLRPRLLRRASFRPAPFWAAASVGALALGVWLGHVSAPPESGVVAGPVAGPVPVSVGADLASAGAVPVVPKRAAEPATLTAIPVPPVPPAAASLPTPAASAPVPAPVPVVPSPPTPVREASLPQPAPDPEPAPAEPARAQAERPRRRRRTATAGPRWP